MLLKFLGIFFSICLSIISFGQQIEVNLIIVDKNTKAPISGAHLFISDGSIGAITDKEGFIKLTIPYSETESLICTHIAYKTLIVDQFQYKSFTNNTIVELESNGIDIEEIELVAKRGKTWKRNYKKFQKAFLGTGKSAAKCTILNPEVLRFNEENGKLSVTAVDLIEVSNDYLMYSVKFLLQELVIEADGSTEYRGFGQFLNRELSPNKRLVKLREKQYNNSLSHFLRSLAKSETNAQLKTYGYEIAIEKYGLGRFQFINTPVPRALISIDSLTGYYKLSFNEFLSVKHLKHKVIQSSDQSVTISANEQQKFGDGREQAQGVTTQFAVSRLFKVEPYILFDYRGVIINKKAVKEYGLWANQRLATTLPIDYVPSPKKDLNLKPIPIDTLQFFVDMLSLDESIKQKAFDFLNDNWIDNFAPPLIEILRFSKDPWQIKAIETLLSENTGIRSTDYFQACQDLWKDQSLSSTYYADFKALIYQPIDPLFYNYFHNRNNQSLIRFDEILWGGVTQDGIPPLRKPKMINSQDADFMGQDDIVFGLLINDEARAYPKRILAWHEFFTDNIQNTPVAGVYCTLCGTVIIYETRIKDKNYILGTSGFLYRSNKLMYDKETQSLWSTILGEPVVGPLVDKGIKLSPIAVETTTWESWKERFPQTKVMSIETGYERNYAEGEAYKSYFATDELMFPVPQIDSRLNNKDIVFIPRTAAYKTNPLAISMRFLKENKWYQTRVGETDIIVLCKKGKDCKAYEAGNHKFTSYKNNILKDDKGSEWEIQEDVLLSTNDSQLNRIPSHESFWFAWFNAFPNTKLIH